MDIQALFTPAQRLAFDLICERTQITALYGGSRSGKTVCFTVYVFMCALLVPNSNQLVLRKHLASMRSAMWHNTFPKVLNMMGVPKGAYKFRGDCERIVFANGSTIWLAGSDNLSRADKLLGNEFSNIWINEASEFDNNTIPLLQSRLAENIGIKNKLLLDFNPPETSHYTYDMIMDHKLVTEFGESDIDINYMLMNPGDNLAHLPPDYIKLLESMPERQRKRFLLGQFVSPDEAIFTESMIRYTDDINQMPKAYLEVVIGVDPACTATKNSDETGIFILGKNHGNYYKIKDLSMRSAPEGWAIAAVDAYAFYSKICANCQIVAEVNQGGDMVGSVIRRVAAERGVNIHYQAVKTYVSKQYRAEDYSVMLATQGWYMDKDQNWRGYVKQLLGYKSMIDNKKSPDRVDAAIIAASVICKELSGLYSGFVM